MTKIFGDTELFKTKADCEELQTTQNIDRRDDRIADNIQ